MPGVPLASWWVRSPAWPFTQPYVVITDDVAGPDSPALYGRYKEAAVLPLHIQYTARTGKIGDPRQCTFGKPSLIQLFEKQVKHSQFLDVSALVAGAMQRPL